MKKINLDKLVRDNWDDEEIGNLYDEREAYLDRKRELNKQVRREDRLRKLNNRRGNATAGD